MAVGSSPYNIGYTFIVFNLWFAFTILFRESFDSPHPQDSWSHDWMVLWFCLAMVPWFGGHSSFPAPIAIDLSTTSFEHSLCHPCNSLMFLVRHVTWLRLWSLLKHVSFFPSDCHFVVRAIYLPSLFQAPTTWWDTMCFEQPTWRANCIWFVRYVGFIYGTYPRSVNPVRAANFLAI